MLFLRRNDIKIVVLVMACLVLVALGSVPGSLWMPFADDLPIWLTSEPLIMQVARLGPFILASVIIAGGIILVQRWWNG